MKKFEFKQAHEEIEIAGQVYKVDLSDEKTKEYSKVFRKFYEDIESFKNVNVEELTAEEQEEILEKQKENMKVTTETILGQGTFDRLFELSGRSTFNYLELLMFLSELMHEKADKLQEDARKKYVKKRR